MKIQNQKTAELTKKNFLIALEKAISLLSPEQASAFNIAKVSCIPLFMFVKERMYVTSVGMLSCQLQKALNGKATSEIVKALL